MNYYSRAEDNKAQVVREMFDHVAPKYDCFNRILSLGLDKNWRKKAIRILYKDLPSGGPILDLGCGSGDLSGMIHSQKRVIGTDFCMGMLKEAKQKFNQLPLSQGDATRLPFKDQSLSGIISAFVIRNVDNLDNCMSEAYRCLLPGGRIVILEFSLPSNPLIRIGFLSYLKLMFPIACNIFKGDHSAYEYLRKSIRSFGEKIEVTKYLQNKGFIEVRKTPLMAGGVQLYQAQKPR